MQKKTKRVLLFILIMAVLAVLASVFVSADSETTHSINCVTFNMDDSGAAGTVYIDTDKGTYEGSAAFGYATENTEVTINAVANPGYEFVEWRLSAPASPENKITSDASYTFNATSTVWLYAIFREIPSGYIVTLYANDGKGTQKKIENVSGTYVLPECPFEAPAGQTFYCWAVGSQSGEQKVPGAAINVTGDILIAAIWDDAQNKYIKKPVGGYTSINETFTVSYKLSIQPDTIWLQFYNDYKGAWTDNFCLATMPESQGAYTQTEVPCVHPYTEETVKWRIAAYKDGVAYYSNTFAIEYIDRTFIQQPESCQVPFETDATVNYILNFDPENVIVEVYVENYQTGNYWTYISGADATTASISGYDFENTRTYRIGATCDKGTFYSKPFTVTWTSGYSIQFNANGGNGSMASLNNRIGQYVLPECSFTAPVGKIFKGWSTSSSGEIISTAAINISGNTTLYAIWQDVLYGDINENEEVSVSDVIYALQLIAGGDVSNLTEYQRIAADVTGDGRIDVSDVIRILQYLASPGTSLNPNI